MTKIKVLLVILSCKKNERLWKRLLRKNPDSIIFYGNPKQEEEYILENRILHLKCGDTYDLLPEKIINMIKSILLLDSFKNVTHIIKIDDNDAIINKNIIKKIPNISTVDYGGQRIYGYGLPYNTFKGNKSWHFNKCPKNSTWFNRKYKGPYTAWADGACGYILSRKSMDLIDKSVNDLNSIKTKHIFEDLMIALILYNNKIHPKKTSNFIIKKTKYG